MVTPFTKYFCRNGYSRTMGPVATTVMASFMGSLGTSLAGMPLRAAAALMEQGIDFQALNKRHFRTKSVARMKLESLIIEHMHLYHNGTVAVAPISLELIARAGATSEDTDDIAAFLGQLKGVLHTATVREHEGGECRVSVRTKADELNATRVCARLGGGGHKAASGCTIKGTVEEAERAILAAIDDQLAQPSQD